MILENGSRGVRKWDKEGKEANKECISRSTTVGNWGSIPLRNCGKWCETHTSELSIEGMRELGNLYTNSCCSVVEGSWEEVGIQCLAFMTVTWTQEEQPLVGKEMRELRGRTWTSMYWNAKDWKKTGRVPSINICLIGFEPLCCHLLSVWPLWVSGCFLFLFLFFYKMGIIILHIYIRLYWGIKELLNVLILQIRKWKLKKDYLFVHCHAYGKQANHSSKLWFFPQVISLTSTAQCLSCWCSCNFTPCFYHCLSIIAESCFPFTLFLNPQGCVAELLTWVSAHRFPIFQTLALHAS